MNEKNPLAISIIEFDSNRKVVLSELQRINPILARMYEGAIHILNHNDIPNKIQLSAHSVREIMRDLPKYLDAVIKNNGPSLGNLTRNLESSWNKLIKDNILFEEASWSQETQKRIKNFLYKCKEYFEDSAAILVTKKQKATETLYILGSSSTISNIPTHVKDHMVKGWGDCFDYFNTVAHNGNTTYEEFNHNLTKIEFLLRDLLVPRPFESMKQIQQIIEESESRTPNIEDLKKILNLMHRTVEYEFFFNNLNSSDWIELLEQEGVFKGPDNIITSNNITEIPFWHPVIYLIKVAPIKPQQVINIIQRTSNTDNSRAHESFVEAALVMPTEISITIYKEIIMWLDGPFLLSIPNKVANLVGRYLEAGYMIEAMVLCEKLFDFQSSVNQHKTYKAIVQNEWEYNELIKLIVTYLDTADKKVKFAFFLISKLEKAVSLNMSSEDGRADFRDYSCVWRRSIAEPNQGQNDDLKDILINWIRDIGVLLIKDTPAYFDQLTDFLFKKDLPIFNRLALHLIKNNLQRKDLIISSLLNAKLATSLETWHEYALLLKSGYSALDLSEKNALLVFISNLNLTKNNEDTSREVSAEESQKNLYRYYYLIQDDLPTDVKSVFDEMKNKYGELEHPEYIVRLYGAEWLQPTSPLTNEELDNKSLVELAHFLNNWEPPIQDILGGSVYGLTQELEKLVSKRCEEFAENISLFKISKSKYIKAIINGFNLALSESKVFNWTCVLDYLSWATNLQNHEDPVLNEWSDVKGLACRFLEKGFSSYEYGVPINLMHTVWQIILNCLNDSDPDFEREKTIKDRNYYQLAINSTRPVALDCAIQYGLWIMRKIENKELDQENCKELFINLDKYLDTRFEKSRAVRSIYGRWLPWLYLLDPSWTILKLEYIFCHSSLDDSYRLAAWNAFLFTGPYDNVFELIKDEYLYALDKIEQNEDVTSDNPIIKLVEHIVIFYLRGKISLDDPIILKLYEKANLKIRLYIIYYIGMMLTYENSERAITFWEFCFKRCDKNENWDELVAFGWWIQAECLNTSWSLEQAILVLKHASHINQSHMIVGKLCVLSQEYPNKVAELFKMIVDKQVKDNELFLWRKTAETLVSQLLNTTAYDITIDVVNKLVAYGFMEFSSFLAKEA